MNISRLMNMDGYMNTDLPISMDSVDAIPGRDRWMGGSLTETTPAGLLVSSDLEFCT